MAILYSMKKNRPTHWRIWRKYRLDKSLFSVMPIYPKVHYVQTRILTWLNYPLSNVYLTSLSNKTNTSISAILLKKRSCSNLTYSSLSMWLSYSLYTLFRLHMSYSLVRSLKTSYWNLSHFSFPPYVFNSKRYQKLQQKSYFRLNRKL